MAPQESGLHHPSKIWNTYTDEAPALATHALQPIVKRFLASADVEVELADIAVAARILSQFPNYLTPPQRKVYTRTEHCVQLTL